jgi:tRNA (cytidine/uridine-2'-O-)-methyltransferase
MLHIALHEPKIPQNTGNIIRLVANTGFTLHLIGPLSFKFNDKNLRRAGLDYMDIADIKIHENYEKFLIEIGDHKIWALTTKATNYYQNAKFDAGDVLLFGSETSGLPKYVRDNICPDNLLRIPMRPNNRSMNLSNTVAIVSYEAWRQLDFAQGL